MLHRYKAQLIVPALVFIAVLASIFYLFFLAKYKQNIPFLRSSSEANWILYYLYPDMDGRGPNFTNISTDFTKEFSLPIAPPKAELHIRAFKEYRLWVNDKFLKNPASRPNWKEMDTLDISPLLRKGKNTLRVKVTCDKGPPALWLYISGLQKDIRTDTTWMASIAGSPYAGAGLAKDCFVYPGGSDSPRPWASFVEKFPVLILFFCVSCAVFYFYNHTYKNTKIANRSTAHSFVFKPKLILAGSIAIWTIVFINNSFRIPVILGFDASGHLNYIQYILDNHTVPLANQEWEAYQPPLFYVISALFLSIARAVFHGGAEYMILKLVPFLCGMGQIFVAYFSSKLIFPDSAGKQTLATAFAALIPMNIYISHYVSNESLSAFLIGVLILITVTFLTRDSSIKLFCMLGIAAGLAFLTKFTVLIVLPVIILVLLYKLLCKERRSLSYIAVRFGLTAVIAVGLAGWFYYRNWVSFGKIFVGNWDPVTGIYWWQDPGFHTYKYFCRFGEVFRIPYFSSFYSFFDSIYASFWGDSLLGGQLAYYNQPWNCKYVSVVYILSLPAMLIIMIGVVRAVGAAIFQADKVWLFLLGLLFVAIWSTVYANLLLPYNAQAKAFYSLFVVVPVALIFALGFSGLDGWLRNKGLLLVRTVLYGWFGTLALTVFFSFFISPAKQGQRLDLSAVADKGRLNEAVVYYTRLLSDNPDSHYARLELAMSYTLQGRYDDAIEQCMKAQQIRPDWPKTLNLLSTLLANKPHGNVSEREQAVRYAERCCQLTGYLWDEGLFTLARAYRAQGKTSLAVKTAERAVKEAKVRGRIDLVEVFQQWLQSVKPARKRP